MNDDFKIELFVFPDGTAVEMIVFDPDAVRPARPSAAQPAAATGAAMSPASTATAPDSLCRTHTSHDEAATPEPAPGAQVCPVCNSELVYPVDWQRSGDSAWSLELRCPNCQMRREVVLGREAVERFNRDLYHGAQALAREAEQMSRRNFEEEAERIISALHGDLIQPMDF